MVLLLLLLLVVVVVLDRKWEERGKGNIGYDRGKRVICIFII